MKLSKKALPHITDAAIIKPDENIFDLPVKVMQFGTGVLLRGLIDCLIDKANRAGIFNGRVVVIKSTSSGDTNAFDEQDGLYTLLVRGIADGQEVEENIICAAISNVLTASTEWDLVLKEAINPELKVIVSNTTEVGIKLLNERIHQSPPLSFPAKLLAVLYHRYQVLGNNKDSGLVIIPTELLPGNGTILKGIIMELISFNQLGEDFEKWVLEANYFCNSLVDRIVPGKPAKAELQAFEEQAGYQDELLIVSEAYRLWAIEGDEKVKNILSFEQADKGIIVIPDIDLYRELKLRLLNGTHTLTCGFAFLSGFDTVKAATDNQAFLDFMQQVMAEIVIAIPYEVDEQQATHFAASVLDRFRNPSIMHLWLNITQQYTTKFKMRVIPVLQQYYKLYNKVPLSIAKGFAAYLLFMRSVKQNGATYIGEFNGVEYPIGDDKAGFYFELWKSSSIDNVVLSTLKNEELWGADLTKLPGFALAVQQNLIKLMA
jgi:tagaturonate reductase